MTISTADMEWFIGTIIALLGIVITAARTKRRMSQSQEQHSEGPSNQTQSQRMED